VFLGIALADAGGPDVTRAAGSLVVFAAGVLVATRLVRRRQGLRRVWPVEVSLTLSLVCLAQIVFAIGWIASDGRPGTGTGNLLVALSALAMGLQSGAVVSLGVQGVFTTAATATVMFLMRDDAQRDSSGPERWRLERVLLADRSPAPRPAACCSHTPVRRHRSCRSPRRAWSSSPHIN